MFIKLFKHKFIFNFPLSAFQILFGLGLFVLPFQIRSLIFASDKSWQLGFFNEYSAFFIYLSEIFFLLSLVFCGLLLIKKKSQIFNETIFQKEDIKTLQKIAPVFLILLATSILVIPFANIPLLSLLNFWRLLLLLGVAIILILEIFPKNLALKILLASFFIQALLGISQYLASGDLGIHFFGESFFDAKTFNVAKIILPDGFVAVRGMGTTAHANILGGLLALVLLLSAKLKRKSVLIYFCTIFVLVGMFFSFSRAAYLAFFIGLIILLIGEFRRKIFSIFVASLIFGLLLINFGQPFFLRLATKNEFPNRLDQITTALEISQKNPLGVGQGNFTFALAENSPYLKHWQLQPVHNFFILKLIEESILVALAWLIIFIQFAIWALREKNFTTLAVLATSFVLANLDHYFATSFAGEAMLILIFGFCVEGIKIEHRFKIRT
jgi:hypothetical protein